jgi:hypothetical protein
MGLLVTTALAALRKSSAIVRYVLISSSKKGGKMAMAGSPV